MRSLAVTTGSAKGIGPHVVEKALRALTAKGPVTVYGTTAPPQDLPQDISWQTFSTASGALLAACEGIKAQKHSALVTGPMAKKDFSSFQSSDQHLIGHTEVLSQEFKTQTCMSFLNWQFRVALMTQHIPLRKVSESLSIDLILKKGEIFGSFIKRHTGKSKPRIGVCGLNPHAATDLFQDSEDQNIVAPACEQLAKKGFEIVGLVSPDSAFSRYKKESWDGLIALYHDQGLSFLKGVSFRDTVNVTLGLPFVRTSVDHGTALGLKIESVDETNMLRALEWAILLSTA